MGTGRWREQPESQGSCLHPTRKKLDAGTPRFLPGLRNSLQYVLCCCQRVTTHQDVAVCVFNLNQSFPPLPGFMTVLSALVKAIEQRWMSLNLCPEFTTSVFCFLLFLPSTAMHRCMKRTQLWVHPICGCSWLQSNCFFSPTLDFLNYRYNCCLPCLEPKVCRHLGRPR